LWEGRFNLKPAFTTRRDDAAVLSCMAYVDLNPISAKMAKTPETSNHTSIQKRTEAIQQHKSQPHKLLPFVGNPRQDMPQGITFSLQDYCELVDTTGRIIRADKAGVINSAHSPILSPLGLSEEQWLTLTTEFEQHFVMQRAQSICSTIQTPHRPSTYTRDGEGQSLTSIRLSLKQVFFIVSNTTRLNHAACNLSWATYLTAFN
jgi:hypothetical protein